MHTQTHNHTHTHSHTHTWCPTPLTSSLVRRRALPSDSTARPCPCVQCAARGVPVFLGGRQIRRHLQRYPRAGPSQVPPDDPPANELEDNHARCFLHPFHRLMCLTLPRATFGRCREMAARNVRMTRHHHATIWQDTFATRLAHTSRLLPKAKTLEFPSQVDQVRRRPCQNFQFFLGDRNPAPFLLKIGWV